MAYTAEITSKSVINIGEGNYQVSISLKVQQDGIEIFVTTVSAIVNETVDDKAAYVKQKLETKLVQAWDQFLAANAVVQTPEALDNLCDTIKADVENYLNQ